MGQDVTAFPNGISNFNGLQAGSGGHPIASNPKSAAGR